MKNIDSHDKRLLKLLDNVTDSYQTDSNKFIFEEKLLFLVDYAKKHIQITQN